MLVDTLLGVDRHDDPVLTYEVVVATDLDGPLLDLCIWRIPRLGATVADPECSRDRHCEQSAVAAFHTSLHFASC